VLARRDRAREQIDAHLRRSGVEKDRVVRIGERRVQIRRVPRDIVELGDFCELVGIAADQDRVRHDTVAVR
jgi:hypothetical protein